MRLQRVLAAAGVAARRVCEEMIEAGRVEVNGTVTRVLPIFVDPARDRITVDGRVLPRAKPERASRPARGHPAPATDDRADGDAAGDDRNQANADDSGHAHPHRPRPGSSVTGQRFLYLMVYKPERVLSTTRDEAGRTTVLDLVDHPAMARGNAAAGETGGLGARVYPVGRLDFHTSGLVLLTNDGVLANRLTHPRFSVPKTYAVWARGMLPAEFIADLERGLNIKHKRAVTGEAKREGLGGRASGGGGGGGEAITLGTPRIEGGKTVVEITLRERGPRSLTEMLGEAGVKVAKVVRTAIGPVSLREVALGQWRELDRREVQALRRAADGGDARPLGPARADKPNRAGTRSRQRRDRGARVSGGGRGDRIGPGGPAAGPGARPVRGPFGGGREDTRRGPRGQRGEGRSDARTGPRQRTKTSGNRPNFSHRKGRRDDL